MLTFISQKIQFKNWPLRFKYAFGLLSLIIVPAFVAYFSLTTLAQSFLENAIGTSASDFAQKVIDSIDQVLFDRIEFWKIYSKEYSLQQVVLESNELFESEENLDKLIRQRDQDWPSFKNQTEQENWLEEIVNNQESQELKRIVREYEDSYGYKVFGEVFVTNKFGVNIAQSGWTSDYYQADEDWWQEAAATGLSVSDLEYDESAGVYSIALGIRLDHDEEMIGVMKVIVNVQEAIDIVEQLVKERAILAESEDSGAYQSLKARLLDAKGNVISSSSSELETRDSFEQVKDLFQPQDERDRGYLIVPDNQSSKESKLYVHAYSKGYRSFTGTGWIIILEYDGAEIFTPVTELKNSFVMTIFIVVLILIVYALWMATLVTRPVQELATVAKKISSGQWKKRFKVKNANVIGQLARSFNEMADELVRSKDYVQEVIETLPDQVATFDHDRQIKLINKPMKKLIGNDNQVSLWQLSALFKFCKQKDLDEKQRVEKFKKAVDQVLDEGKIVKFSQICIGDRHYELFLVPIVSEKKQIHGGVLILHDINKLMEIDRMKTEFISVAAHQLRTPLGITRWNLELLLSGEKGKLTRKIKTSLEDVYKSNLRLIEIVSDLLNISRLEQGRLRYKLEAIDLNQFIETIIQKFNEEVKKKQLVIEFKTQKQITLNVDLEQLTEVIENLISNAVKYSRPKSKVSIQLKVVDKKIIFSVKDSGIGIPKKDQSKIFEKFFRATNASISHVDGSGLGLYIVREYVKSWGGKVSFETKEGQGSKFIVILPKKIKSKK